MRRLMAAAVLAAVCATAACSDSGDSPGSALGGGSSSAPSSATTSGAADGAADDAADGAAGSGNTKQVCADAEKVIDDTAAKFGQELSRILGAGANGDASAEAEAVKAVNAFFTDWANGMREQADKATDGQLKAALTDIADQIAKAAGRVTSMDDLGQVDKLMDGPEMDAATAKLESLCG